MSENKKRVLIVIKEPVGGIRTFINYIYIVNLKRKNMSYYFFFLNSKMLRLWRRV